MAFHLEIKPDSVEEGADKGGIWQARELILQKAVDEPRAHEQERNVTQRSHEQPNSLERTCCDKNKQKNTLGYYERPLYHILLLSSQQS